MLLRWPKWPSPYPHSCALATCHSPSPMCPLLQVYREWMLDRSDLVVQRPQQQAAPTAKSPILVGPASAGGCW